jgi:hypothetical protein
MRYLATQDKPSQDATKQTAWFTRKRDAIAYARKQAAVSGPWLVCDTVDTRSCHAGIMRVIFTAPTR